MCFNAVNQEETRTDTSVRVKMNESFWKNKKNNEREREFKW